VSTKAPNSEGVRSAVLLRRGTFGLAGSLSIKASGVVLRGSGSGEGGTVIRLTGEPHRFLEIRGAGTWEADGNSAAITDRYVPAGADSFQVDRAGGFHV